MFLTLNTGKRSVTLDLSTRTGRELLLQLAKTADLIVESYRPGTLERFGLGPEQLAQAGPAALVRITNFGQTGPMRDFEADDLVEYAAAGILQITGLPEGGRWRWACSRRCSWPGRSARHWPWARCALLAVTSSRKWSTSRSRKRWPAPWTAAGRTWSATSTRAA